MKNTCNTYEIAEAIKPVLNKNNLIQKLCFKAVAELKTLREK